MKKAIIALSLCITCCVITGCAESHTKVANEHFSNAVEDIAIQVSADTPKALEGHKASVKVQETIQPEELWLYWVSLPFLLWQDLPSLKEAGCSGR